jgi:hypothetical protein
MGVSGFDSRCGFLDSKWQEFGSTLLRQTAQITGRLPSPECILPIGQLPELSQYCRNGSPEQTGGGTTVHGQAINSQLIDNSAQPVLAVVRVSSPENRAVATCNLCSEARVSLWPISGLMLSSSAAAEGSSTLYSSHSSIVFGGLKFHCCRIRSFQDPAPEGSHRSTNS